MLITTKAIHAGCSALIRSVDPTSKIFDNPTFQGDSLQSIFPAWWILHRENSMEHEPAGRLWLTFGIELVYVLDKQTLDTRLYDKYFEMADKLAASCGTIVLTDGVESMRVHTLSQNWSVEQDALHFSFNLKLRGSEVRETTPTMQTEVTKAFIK